MSKTLWIVLGVAAVFALGYVLAMRNVFNQSRDAYKKVDFRKIRRWKDDKGKEEK